jgi:hypothetical protein
MKTKLFVFVITFLIVHSIFNIDNCMCQWVRDTNGIGYKNIECLTSSGNNLFAGTTNSGIYISSDNGSNWIRKALENKYIYSLASNGNVIFAGIDSGICRSSDNGNTWSLNTLSEFPSAITSIATNGNEVLTAWQNLDAAQIFRSTDSGNNWIHARDVISNHTRIAIYQNYYHISTGGAMPFFYYTSSNYGVNWSSIIMYTFGYPYCIGVIGNYVYIGTQKYYTNDSVYGFCISSNNGNSWVMTSLFKRSINTIATSGNNVIAGTIDSGIYVSTNNGQDWFKKNEGFPSLTSINSLYIFNNYIYAGCPYLWRRPLSELITGVNNINSEIPSSFSLLQNYPNPFNPTTNIKYQITNNKYISLKIFDILGKEVTTLVNEKQVAGTYEVSFDASNFSSGIYFYSLFVDGIRIDTKRMVLIK